MLSYRLSRYTALRNALNNNLQYSDVVLMKLDWLVSFEHCKHTADIWFLQIFNKTLTLYF